jgi:beta-glucosidase
VSFPKNFVWGAAAASYQIEGAAFEDGKGLSVWDMVTRHPGKIYGGHTGDVACDHYHRYKEDVALMKQIGLQAYRLSVSWPRVMPDGVGAVNKKGLDFYDRLIDELLAAGIEPWVTLFHWDYPYELFCKGGWLNNDSSDWFVEYTNVVVNKLSDRVNKWMTINEPQCFIGIGHYGGDHAPLLGLWFNEVLRASHNVLLAHGKSVQAIRAIQPNSVVGLASVGKVCVPASDDPADIEAARKATFAVNTKAVGTHTWWTDPVFKGEYPADGLELFAPHMPKVNDGDMEIIHQPLDFCGINMYGGSPVKATEDGWKETSFPEGYPQTAFHWNVVPQAHYWGPKFLYERYGKPIIFTESGLSNIDWVAVDGKVHDPQRIDYLTRHLREFGRAMDEGVEGGGFFTWSLMDNFEWAHGFKERFGLIHVDYQTLKRTLKDSAYWYGEVIKANGKNLG